MAIELEEKRESRRNSGVFSIPVAPKIDHTPIKMHLMAYGPHEFEEHEIHRPEEVKKYLKKFPVLWLNVDGISDINIINAIGEIFHLHKLAIEDVLQVQERAKVETYGPHLFIVGRMVIPGKELATEQISLFIGDNFLVTFQEKPGGDCLNPVRMRIRRHFDNIQEKNVAYLAYTILDTIVDAYFPVLEHYGEILEDLEDEIVRNPHRGMILRIHDIKRDLLVLRRAIWPLRDAVHVLQHESLIFGAEELRFYLRDLYDHIMRVIEFIEVGRELCSDMMDFYLSNVGNRTNEVMKVLAIISTIFMPLTFVAGVYGMNFNPDSSPWNMPELNWYYGYPFALIMMGVFVVLLLMWFRSKKWI